MARYAFGEVTVSPNPVNANGAVKISVSITETPYTWDYLKDHYTWDSIKASGETWDTLKE